MNAPHLDRPRAALLGLSMALAVSGTGCTTSHGATPDAPTSRGDTDPVATTCSSVLVEGARCAFTEPCRAISDFWMGRCGTETWSCVDGRIRYRDDRFPCSLDGGPAGPDARPTWCAGYDAPPAATSTDCRTEADCSSAGGTCWAPGDTSGLHAGGACPMDCLLDAECASGSICEALNGGSCHACRPACTESSCGPWEACGADGHCAPAQCLSDGYPCPPGSSCGLTGTPADLHGCSLAACTSDADCGCGACVLGLCALGPGRCELPRP